MVIVTNTPELIYSFNSLGSCSFNVSVVASNEEWTPNVTVQHTLEVRPPITIQTISISTWACKIGSNCPIKAVVYPEGNFIYFMKIIYLQRSSPDVILETPSKKAGLFF